MTIDPRFAFWLGVWTSILLLIASGAISFDGALPAAYVPLITKWCAILGAINSTILTAASGYSSNKLGPMVNLPANPTMNVVKILLVAFALSFLVAGGSAQAGQLQFTGNAIADAKANAARLKAAASPTGPKTPQQPVDILQKLMDDIAAKAPALISNVVGAINEADADAATLTNPSDPSSFRDAISHACYPAQVKFLQSLPQIQAIKAPSPYNVIVLFQRKRDLVAQIKAGLPSYLKVGCAALLGDEATIFAQTLGMIGVTIGAGTLTGIFPAAAPLTLALPAILG